MKKHPIGIVPAVLGVLLLSALPILPTLAAEATHADLGADLLGLWGGWNDFGPSVGGPLTLEIRDSRWQGEIAGYRFAVENKDGRLSFEIPGDQGAFHGRLDPETGTIHGQWIQPGAVSTFGQRFSTPVHLQPVAPKRWRGTVQPLPDQVHLYFVLEPGAEGTVRAFLRNPEGNFGRIFDFTEVRRQEDRVEFRGTLAWQKGSEPRTFLGGLYHPDADVLSVFIEDLGGTYDLERLRTDAVSDFFPRAWARQLYHYHPPASTGDGWETATLQSVGMVVEPIEALVREIVATPMDAVDAPHIDAVLIARHGKLVLEEYFHGHNRERTHDTRSASKSLTSTLVGALIHAGHLSLDTPVYATMHGGTPPDGLDPRAARMTLEHLITMSSGLACDDWDSDSPGGEDRMQSQTEQPDWYRYTLDLPMLHEPGEHVAYCSGGMSLAGGVVARSLGRPLTEIFDRYLARPLEMGIYHTNLMPTGEAYAGGGLRLTARDFLKFGRLLLDDGQWNGRRILAPGWAEAAIVPRHTLGTTRPEGYGYGWWRLEYELDGHRWSAFYAGGNGGNYILGVPDLDLVIVFQASNYGQAVQHETKYDFVPRFILRSVLENPPPP